MSRYWLSNASTAEGQLCQWAWLSHFVVNRRWRPIDEVGSLIEVAAGSPWDGPEQPGAWQRVVRRFRDGHEEEWWALEVIARPYGPNKTHRAVVVTTDPQHLPTLTTWNLLTDLPAPGTERAATSPLAAVSVPELVRLYGLRMWVEQSYKQVKHALGWAEYQVRSDQAIRRHWVLVWCAFSFCWWHLFPCETATLLSAQQTLRSDS